MSDNKLFIRVESLPNGYSLTVNKQKYMAFTPERLMEEMFVHVGLGLDSYMNRDTISDLMTACATWPDAKDGLVALKKLQEENTKLNGTIENLKNIQRRQENMIEQLRGDVVTHKNKKIVKKTKKEKSKRTIKQLNTVSKQLDIKAKKGKREKGDAAVLEYLEKQLAEHWEGSV